MELNPTRCEAAGGSGSGRNTQDKSQRQAELSTRNLCSHCPHTHRHLGGVSGLFSQLSANLSQKADIKVLYDKLTLVKKAVSTTWLASGPLTQPHEGPHYLGHKTHPEK